jgi:hypothetical protein
MNAGSHWAPKPAPPSAVGVTIHGSPWRSSAIVIFHGWRALISSLSQAMNDQPSRRSVAGLPGLPSTARMYTVASKRRPSQRNSSSQVIALSRRKVRTSPRP